MYYSSNERVKIVFINGNATYISTISGDLRWVIIVRISLDDSTRNYNI